MTMFFDIAHYKNLIINNFKIDQPGENYDSNLREKLKKKNFYSILNRETNYFNIYNQVYIVN